MVTIVVGDGLSLFNGMWICRVPAIPPLFYFCFVFKFAPSAGNFLWARPAFSCQRLNVCSLSLFFSVPTLPCVFPLEYSDGCIAPHLLY